MNIASFIDNLIQQGFNVEMIGNRLSVSSSKAMSLTDQQKQYIKANQQHILEFLNAREMLGTRNRKIIDGSILPLSFAQQRLWFIDKLYSDSSYAYNVPVAFRIRGELRLDLLECSMNLLVKRHGILRTVFKQNAEGKIYQEILPFDEKTKITILVKEIDGSEIDAYLLSESLHRFDLCSEQLIRVFLFEISNKTEKILLINQHHIISDAWSLGLLFKEVSYIYHQLKLEQEINLPPPDAQYADYITWEKEYLQNENLANPLEYWSENLKGYSDLNLVSIENRLKFEINKGSNITFQVEEDTVHQLKEYARNAHSTVHLVLLSAFYILLARYSGQEDLVIGVPYANRDAFKIENTLGFFANMLPIRINIKNPIAEDLLHYVKHQSLDAYHHNVGFEHLVEHLKIRRDNNRTPIFQVAFAYYTVAENFNLEGAVVEKINFDRGSAKYDLNLTFEMVNGQLKGELEFNASLFNVGGADNFVQAYKILLQDLLRHPKKKISELKILSQSAYEAIISKINTSKSLYPQDKMLHQCFEEQVEKTPDHIAVVFGQQQLTYRELNERSNQLANLIGHRYKEIYHDSIKENVFIGLYIDRSLETVISILSVLKSGAAYVPFDVNTSDERLKFQILDSNCRLILTQSNKNNDLFNIVKEKSLLLNLDELQHECSTYSKNNLSVTNAHTDPIYIIYTSGSTGKPKGVVQLHYNVRRLFWACEKHFDFTDKDVWTLFHSYGFDFSVWEMWGALLYGGKLIIPTFLETRDLHLFHKLLAFHKVTVLNQTPTAFYELAKIDDQLISHGEMKLDALRYVIFGGELLKIHLLKNWVSHYGLNQPALINMYGITEIAVHATYKRILSDELNQPISNIGKPLADLTAYVLDGSLNPLPMGIPGELYIGGSGLAKCYLNLPELTAEKFINNPFASQEDRHNNFNVRLYKTGDVVRWRENGDLEYIGRNDHQIQLRGFRIELGDIESQLLSHEAIHDAVVLCRERQLDDNIHKSLYAYYIVNDKSDFKEKITSRSLREYLVQRLPDYMVPSYFVRLDAFPLTTNGKLDQNALPEPDFSDAENINYHVPPCNELEQKFCHIWQELLGVENVSTHSHFFEMGGNSILLIQLVAKIKKELSLTLSLLDLFTYPNIKSLVNYLVSRKTVENRQEKPKKLMSKDDIAIIGYSGAFSGCDSIQEFWDKIIDGIDCITRLSVEDALKIGVKEALLKQKTYIKATGLVANIDQFDAAFFDISPSEAKFMDPQTRLFIEHAWKALELAGYISQRENISIGVFAGAGKPTYLYDHLKKSAMVNEENYEWEMDTLADPRRISTLTSFHLHLTGPSVFIDTACSTSMVAIIEAAIQLQAGLCEIAIAGGCTLYFPENFGYRYKNNMVGSSDGICAPFSQEASGIVPGSGVGVVVLKRLEDAIKDKDIIHAVIKGYGINNDGHRKVGYVAPSVNGQKDCILSALNAANITKDSISYIECHGTGTKLGDSIEISVLDAIFGAHHSAIPKQFLGSIKANIGHADTAAGVASVIKVCKMLESKKIPPQIHCKKINDQINTANVFKIAGEAQAWEATEYPRRAGVTSLGIGGTNAHLILEEAHQYSPAIYMDTRPSHYLFSISAKTPYSLNQARMQLLAYLKKNHSVDLLNVAYTLHTAREAFSNRYAFVAKDYDSVIQALESFESHIDQEVEVKNSAIQEKIQQLLLPPSSSTDSGCLDPSQPLVRVAEQVSDYKLFVSAIGKLWLQGGSINWDKFYEGYDCHRVELPTYSFDKKSFWVPATSEKADIQTFSDLTNPLEASLFSHDKALAVFWEKVFEIENIDIHANFFDLGGNSVIAIRLIQLISDHFNIEISVNTLFENPTIASLGHMLSHLSTNRQNISLNQHSLENALKKFWAAVFMIEDVDIHANFFELGGNSVLAIRLIQLISDHLNAEVSINTLFENPTIASLSGTLSHNLAKGEPVFQPIVPDTQNAYEPFPLTDIQRAYLLGRQNLYDLGNVATHAYIERDYYDLEIDKVESTFNQLITRHPMLRVVFDVNSVSQRILADVPYYKIPVQQIDAVEKDVQDRRLSAWESVH